MGSFTEPFEFLLHFHLPRDANHAYEWMNEVWCMIDLEARFDFYELFGMSRKAP